VKGLALKVKNCLDGQGENLRLFLLLPVADAKGFVAREDAEVRE